MQNNTLFRLAPIFAAAALLAVGFPASIHAAKFPPLNTPAAYRSPPGASLSFGRDLFTADPDGATKFYCGLLGWTAAALEQKGKGYTVFSNEGRPVAGLAPRSVSRR